MSRAEQKILSFKLSHYQKSGQGIAMKSRTRILAFFGLSVLYDIYGNVAEWVSDWSRWMKKYSKL